MSAKKIRQPATVIESWLEAIEAEGRGLTKWENDFVTSVSEQFSERGTLSEKQEEILERIYTDRV